MIWGCIAHGIKGPLVFIPPDRRLAVDYVDLVLVMISSHIRFFAYLICLPKPYISMLPKCIR